MKLRVSQRCCSYLTEGWSGLLSLIPSGLNPSGRHHSTSLTTPSSVNGDMEKVYPECGKKITSTGSDFTPPGSPDFLIHLFLFTKKISNDYYQEIIGARAFVFSKKNVTLHIMLNTWMIRNFKISSCKISVNLDYVHKMKDWNKPHQRGIIHPTTIYGCCHQLVARTRIGQCVNGQATSGKAPFRFKRWGTQGWGKKWILCGALYLYFAGKS